MANINDIINQFDALKPSLAADFTASVIRTHSDLLKSANLAGKSMRILYTSSWGSQGYAYRNLVCRFLLITNGSVIETELDTAYLAKQAQAYANDQINAFTAKLVRKLGVLENVAIIDLQLNRFTFDITGNIAAGAVRVTQNRIINCSPKGNLFHQWPSLIYFNGKKISEAQFKKLAGLEA